MLKTMKTAHISDLHFGRHMSREKLQSLEGDLLHLAPDLIVVSGDITDRGTRAQFRDARDFLVSLNIPFITVPGNREICVTAPWEWLIPKLAMRRYSQFFGHKDQIIHQSEEHKVVFFGLNSVHRFPSWPGKIDREARYWFKEQSARFDGYVKVLVVHHPVLPVVRSSSFWAHFLSDAGELLNICTTNNVALILQGHKHRSAVMEIILPERDARLVVCAGGAPLMPYWDSIYHSIEISHDSIVVQPREYDGSGFAARESHRFSLNQQGRSQL